MCGGNHEVKEVNTAKCWAISVLVFGILACIGFLGGAWIQGIGGILCCVGSGILICCGPESGKPGGDGKENAAAICMIIGGAIEIIGAVVGLIVFFGIKSRAEESCSYLSGYGSAESDCINTAVGIAGVVIFPSVGLGVVSAILSIIAGVNACKAKNALAGGKGGSA